MLKSTFTRCSEDHQHYTIPNLTSFHRRRDHLYVHLSFCRTVKKRLRSRALPGFQSAEIRTLILPPSPTISKSDRDRTTRASHPSDSIHPTSGQHPAKIQTTSWQSPSNIQAQPAVQNPTPAPHQDVDHQTVLSTPMPQAATDPQTPTAQSLADETCPNRAATARMTSHTTVSYRALPSYENGNPDCDDSGQERFHILIPST